MIPKYSDKDLIELLASGEKDDLTKVITYLKLKITNRINSLILKRGGTKEDAEELLNDALLVARKYAKGNRFKPNTDVIGFIYGVVRNKHQPGNSTLTLSDNFDIPDLTTKQPNEEKLLKLKKALQQLSEGCRKIIFAFYYQKKSMKEIMEIFALGSEQAAKYKKSRCMKSLKDLFK